VTRATTPITASVYAECERRLGALLDTGRDVLILQGEAILLLEATARSLGGPGVSALNLVSGPYGQIIGDWLGDGGAAVSQLEVAFDRALDPESVADALEHNPVDIVSVVHAEAATGVVNPLAEIAAAAHVAGAIVVVDAVASVGAEPLLIDEWDLDLVMIGLQKAPGGPTGVCALVINDRGWAQIARNPRAPRASILSLLDWKERWIDAGRRRIPGYAYEHEMRALIGMLDALEGDVGFRRTIARHHRARDGARPGARIRAMGRPRSRRCRRRDPDHAPARAVGRRGRAGRRAISRWRGPRTRGARARIACPGRDPDQSFRCGRAD
jgi:aspartate aminotransferase-like enzyme